MPLKAALAVALAVLLPHLAAGQSFFDDFAPQQGELRVDYNNRSYFNAGVLNQHGALHMVRHDLRLSVPVSETEQGLWLLGGRVRIWDIDTDSRFQNDFGPLTLDGDYLPNQLYDLRLETSYRHEFNNGWTGGINAAIGSASNKPFASADEWLVAVTGYVRIPVRETDAWMLFVNFDNNRQFAQNIPIPGFAYDWRPSDRLNILAGVPVAAARWTPLDRLSIEAFYLLPRIIHAELGYEVIEQVTLYTAFDWDNDRWLRAQRDDADDRLFYFEKRVMAGVRWAIAEQVALDFGGGWAFDRFFFEGEDYGDRGDSRIDISDGPLMMLQLNVRL